MADLIASIPASSRWKVDKDIDFENKQDIIQGGTVPLHIGRIAAQMINWEGTIGDNLGLTRVDIANVKEKYPQNPELQRYDYTKN